VYVELKRGLGKMTPTGAITPNGKPEVVVNVIFTLYEARRMAFSVLAYLGAWDVCRMFAQKSMVSGFAPYLVMPISTNEQTLAVKQVPQANGIRIAPKPSPPANGKVILPAAKVPQIVHSPTPPLPPSSTSLPPRPVTRKASKMPAKSNSNSSTANVTKAKLPPPAKSTRILRYGDGSLVNLANAPERETYLNYRKTHQTTPPSKRALQTFYLSQAEMMMRNADWYFD
jgi:hypothetical protein